MNFPVLTPQTVTPLATPPNFLNGTPIRSTTLPTKHTIHAYNHGAPTRNETQTPHDTVSSAFKYLTDIVGLRAITKNDRPYKIQVDYTLNIHEIVGGVL